jgi:hypothetical protein
MSFTSRALDLADGDPVRAEKVKAAVLEMFETGLKMKAAGYQFVPGAGVINPRQQQMLAEITSSGKAVTPDTVKEWDLATPVSNTAIQYSGLTPYSLESALIHLYPKDLTLRNSAARETKAGPGFEFRRITSVTNSAYNVNTSPFFVSTSNTITVNGTTLNRPPNITYTGDATFLPFVEMGWSDEVALRLIYAANGWSDPQAESALALLNAHMLGEEKALLMSRSTSLGVSGISATAASSSTITSGSGITGGTVTTVLVVFNTGFGGSKAITATGLSTLTTGHGVDLTFTGAVPAGTVSISTFVEIAGTPTWYVGTSTLQGGISPAKFTVYTGTTPSTSADNGSNPAYTLGGTLISGASSSTIAGYDGLISEASTNGGYSSYLGSTLSTSSPGYEFYTALESLYATQGADPDLILTTGSIASELWSAVTANGGTNNYRVTLTAGQDGTSLGGAVNSIANPATGTVAQFKVHRYMPAGIAVVHSTRVPWADSNVAATLKVVNAADTMYVNWPEIGFSRDASTYTLGTACFEAPVLDGIITGIQ